MGRNTFLGRFEFPPASWVVIADRFTRQLRRFLQLAYAMKSSLCCLAALLLGTSSASAAVATPPQLATDLAAAAQAGVISLSGINPVNCPEISMSATWSGGQL